MPMWLAGTRIFCAEGPAGSRLARTRRPDSACSQLRYGSIDVLDSTLLRLACDGALEPLKA
jgi:hypothetical protein